MTPLVLPSNPVGQVRPSSNPALFLYDSRGLDSGATPVDNILINLGGVECLSEEDRNPRGLREKRMET